MKSTKTYDFGREYKNFISNSYCLPPTSENAKFSKHQHLN